MLGRLALALGILVVVAGTTAATWYAAGGQEPSTRQDRLDALMFPEAPQSAGSRRIYFQAFQTVEGATLNPNVGVLDGRFLPPGAARHRAMLGLWTDCNRDGHVGLAESALLDYRAQLLLDDTLCPAGSLHNTDGWVSEMIGIGMVDPCEHASEATRNAECGGLPQFHENERVLYANGTMVWGDLGEPGALPPAECPLAPPPGTTGGTGLLLAYVDCQTAGRIASTLRGAGVDPATLDPPLPVTPFGGPYGPGLLERGSGEPAATVWDCAAPREVVVAAPPGAETVEADDPSGGRLTGPQPALPVVGTVTLFEDHDKDPGTPGKRRVALADDGALVWIPAPAPALHDPRASWWDAGEAALDGPRGDCDGKSAVHGLAPGPLVESGSPMVAEARKDRASLAFTFYDGHRGINERIDFLAGPTTPSDGGLLYLRHGRGGAGPLWSADEPSVHEPQLVTRGTLSPTGATIWTYYATLGPAALDAAEVPPGAGRVYGAEACGESGSGVRGGWVCDPDAWWRDALGRDAMPRYSQGEPYAPRPGQTYHLRDVDCYDGHVAAGAAYASTALLADTLC